MCNKEKVLLKAWKDCYLKYGVVPMISIGIDVVEISRARAIYRTHRDRLRRILTAREFSYLSSSRDKSKTFAEILAVKEAVFKALEVPWFGLEGWKKIGLRVRQAHQFSIYFGGDLKKYNAQNDKSWISVASTRKFVLARVLIER